MTKLEQMVQTVNIERIDQAKLENDKIIIDTTLGYDDIIKVHFDINADIFEPYDLKSALTTLTSIKIAAFAYYTF